jgi:hypothetical protein
LKTTLGESVGGLSYAIHISSTKGNYYLLFAQASERDQWSYFIKRAADALPRGDGTPTERALSLIEPMSETQSEQFLAALKNPVSWVYIHPD